MIVKLVVPRAVEALILREFFAFCFGRLPQSPPRTHHNSRESPLPIRRNTAASPPLPIALRAIRVTLAKETLVLGAIVAIWYVSSIGSIQLIFSFIENSPKLSIAIATVLVVLTWRYLDRFGKVESQAEAGRAQGVEYVPSIEYLPRAKFIIAVILSLICLSTAVVGALLMLQGAGELLLRQIRALLL